MSSYLKISLFCPSNSLQGQNLKEGNSWDLLDILEPKIPSNLSLKPKMSSRFSLKPNMLSNSSLKPNMPSNSSLQLNLPNTSSLSPDIHPNLPNTIELNKPIVPPRNEGIKANSHWSNRYVSFMSIHEGRIKLKRYNHL